ncbi:heterokaryon incompatibility protein-domain-containing protein [Kalaharituber pfeilii]|nr:heterokaryon incompatibility protein-domain-containing protein [Kalaharituber pfeilii]
MRRLTEYASRHISTLSENITGTIGTQWTSLTGNRVPLPPDTAPLCEICAALDLHAILRNGIPTKERVSLGQLVDILAKGAPKSDHGAPACGLCKLIALMFIDSWRLDKECAHVDISAAEVFLNASPCASFHGETQPPEKKPYRLYFTFNDKPTEIYLVQVEKSSRLLPNLQLLEEDAWRFGRKTDFHGRRIGETLDPALVKEWISTCEKFHGENCSRAWWKSDADKDKPKIPRSTRMVDVVDMKLVHASQDCRYVALSYLWGDVEISYRTVTANYQDRFELPPTISDSILLVRSIGERYLWVDSLCIIQDDYADKGEQIGEMHNIYGSSLLTICGAGADSARAPMPGIRPGTRPNAQVIEVVQGLHLAIPLGDLRGTILGSAWESRGWTYQERVLSMRRLYITPTQAFFNCMTDIWCEDSINERNSFPGKSASYPDKYTSLPGRPSFPSNNVSSKIDYYYYYRFMDAVASYSRRRLTFETDIVNAFMAVLTMFTEGFASIYPDPISEFRPFQFGLPMCVIEPTILWLPQGSSPLTRRTGVKDVHTPSWSWLGWRGGHTAVGERPEPGPISFDDVQGFIAGKPGCAQSLVQEWVLVDEDNVLRKLKMLKEYKFSTTHTRAEEALFVRYKGLPQAEEFPPLLDVLSDLQKANPEQSSKVLVPGTLIFRTSSLRLQVAKVAPEAQTVPYTSKFFALFSITTQSKDGQVIVGKTLLPVDTPSGTEFDFIVLSRASGDYTACLPEHERPDGRRYFGYLLNVMVIHEAAGDGQKYTIDIGGRRYTPVERVSIGVVFERRWVEAAAALSNSAGTTGIAATERLVFLQ